MGKLINRIFFLLLMIVYSLHAGLTQQEQEYIANNKNIAVCLKNNQEPIVIKYDDAYAGIAIDLLKIISQQTHL